jgi:hypothetical protein
LICVRIRSNITQRPNSLAVRLAGGGVFKIAAVKPDRYKGFAPSEGFGLNTNLCGRSWSCATAAIAS